MTDRKFVYYGAGDYEPSKVRSVLGEYFGVNLLELISEEVKKGNLNFFIAGGSITSIFTATKINDLDIYFPSKGDETKFLKLVTDKKSEIDTFKVVCASDNATTLIRMQDKMKYVIQLIHRFYFETPEDCIWSFDFSIVQGAYDYRAKNVVLGEYFIRDNLKRVLRYTNSSRYPICALHRTKKYVSRGYKLPGTTLVAISMAINSLKINSFADLKDQLMGIDTMFFDRIIKEFEEDNQKDFNLELDDLKDGWRNSFLERVISGVFGDENDIDCAY